MCDSSFRIAVSDLNTAVAGHRGSIACELWQPPHSIGTYVRLVREAWESPLVGSGQYFYFFMSRLIAAVIVYGFSFTIGENLIHPAIPRPWILHVHATVFSSWLVF